MADDELTEIKQKLDDLITQHSKMTQMTFSYLNAMIQVMVDKGITNQEESGGYLKVYKEQFKSIDEIAEFEKIMEQFKKKRDDDESAGG